MCLLVESIQIRNGVLLNSCYHKARMKASSLACTGKETDFDPVSVMVPERWQTGIVKCRITYGKQIDKIEFEPYTLRKIRSLRMVFDNTICYHHKFADRSKLVSLLTMRGDADDILIVKNDMITDTSFGNVVFLKGDRYFTPSSYLLNGTKRRHLLDDGVIIEKDITTRDIISMDKLIIINAMLDLTSGVEVEISSIF